jgi:predicted hydrocarbon binding protein
MNPELSIRQEVFIDLRRAFTETIGEVSFARFMSLLPTSLKLILARDDNPDAWVPAREFSILLAAVDMQAHPMLVDFATAWGHQFILNRTREFVGDLTPSQIDSLVHMFHQKRSNAILHVASRLQKGMELLPRWFYPLDVAVDERVSPSQLVFNAQARPVNLPLFCNVLSGLAGGILAAHRIPFLRIHEEYCMTAGHMACSFVILFEPETPLSFF